LQLFTVATVGLACSSKPSDPHEPSIAESLEVDVEGGRVKGALIDGVISFRGIPYAAAPAGERRWAAPDAVMEWDGVRPAVSFGSDCMQTLGGDEPVQTTPAEDCLFVNVWTPPDAAPDAALPVMVWIHGGGFVGGGSSIPFYDGSAFSRRGLVVVSLNYRLARLGFFAHPALSNASPPVAGNFGFMDQIAALAWVQRNIAAFGGDPAKVTLVGESAGGASVLALATSPAMTGAFRGVVVLSGGGRTGLAIRDQAGGTPERPSADQLDSAYAATLGVEGSDAAALAALRALPAGDVQGDLTLRTLAAEALFGDGHFQGTQMRDGNIVLDDPGDRLLAGAIPSVPIVVGTTAQEFPVVLPPRDDPFAYFGPDAASARAAYGVPEGPLTDELVQAIVLGISQDITMHEPARFIARQMTTLGNPAWLYRFTYTAESTRPQSMSGQTHAGELPLLFDTLPARYADSVTERDRQTAAAFNHSIANFVLTGNPNGEGAPDWPRFDPALPALLNFTMDDGPVYGVDPLSARLDLVQRAVERDLETALPAEEQ
jgi:para-nitrobenzyl esterase